MTSGNVTSMANTLSPSDWVSIGTAMVTLFLVIAAFISIWQVNAHLKKEKRERFLKEIKDWTLQIMKIGGNMEGTPMVDSLQVLILEGKNISETVKTDAVIKSTKRILNALASEAASFIIGLNKLGDEDIHESFCETIVLLKQFDTLLTLWLKNKLVNLDAVSRLKVKLDLSAATLGSRLDINLFNNL